MLGEGFWDCWGPHLDPIYKTWKVKEIVDKALRMGNYSKLLGMGFLNMLGGEILPNVFLMCLGGLILKQLAKTFRRGLRLWIYKPICY